MSKKITLTNTTALALQMAQACAVRAYGELENRLFLHSEYDPMDFVWQDGNGERIVDGSIWFYPQDSVSINFKCTLNYEYRKFTEATVVIRRWEKEDKKFICTIEAGELRVVDCNAEAKKTEEVPVSRGFWRSLADFFTRKHGAKKLSV
ncbi:MAG: hypothetical protein WC242_00225 [Candidatus Paceibacterota bacterium]